jgi:2-phosphoglycerate kinase
MTTSIYWLGGSPCSGKSTIAELLSKRYNLTYFSCDAAFDRHLQASDPVQQPTLHRLRTMTSDEIWLEPVAAQLAREIAIYCEEFPLLLADLAALPTDRPILAEGAALMPTLVMEQLHAARNATWVVPTAAFQRHHYAQRPWIADVLKACSDPDQAFTNWMARDSAFAEYVAATAKQHAVPLLWVDGTQTIAENAAWVAEQLGLVTAHD